MKVESTELPLDIEILGAKKLVNFNVETLTRTNEDKTTSTYYRYSQLQMNIADSDDAVLKAKTEQMSAEAKEVKLDALDKLVVTTSFKNTFDGNETARNNMLSAITSAVFLNKTEATWKLADNTSKIVSLNELKEALALSIQKVGEIVTA